MFNSESENCWMCNFDLNTDHCSLCGRVATPEEANYQLEGVVATETGYGLGKVTVNIFLLDLKQHHGKCGECFKKYWDWEMGTKEELGRITAETNLHEHMEILYSRKWLRKYRKFMNRVKDSR